MCSALGTEGHSVAGYTPAGRLSIAAESKSAAPSVAPERRPLVVEWSSVAGVALESDSADSGAVALLVVAVVVVVAAVVVGIVSAGLGGVDFLAVVVAEPAAAVFPADA